MRKTPFILLAGVIAALILSDVIEIRFHAEKLADIPGAIAQAAQDGSMYEKIRTRAVTTKRLAERLIIKDEKQRLEIALRYVEQDSERLRHLAEGNENDQPEKLAAQADLLNQSLAQLREQSQEVSVEDLVAFKDKAQTALDLARETVEASEKIKTHFENLQSRLTEVRESLENQIGRLTKEAEEEGDVAGTNTNGESKEPTPTPTPEATIPLKF